ncbi:MAG: hypothetical protein ACXVAN_07265 [Polyangia bacterium]
MTRRTKPDTQQTVRAVLADVIAELARAPRAAAKPTRLAERHTVVPVEDGCLDFEQRAADPDA